MEWNLKAPSWDLSEFEEAAISNIHGVQGSSSLGGFSIDLKLGRVGNFTEKPAGVAAKMANLASSGSSKRARAAGNGTQIASCLVDGCNSDLTSCREYHRRHKVCEQHSKTPQVTINGHKQRFCQQCSRFHSLEEFDEGKRSCRKRLDGHNRRRRKPQPEPMSRSGSFLSNYQGSQLLPFSNAQVYPSTTVMNPAWTSGGVSTCEDARLFNQHQQFNLLDKQSSFLGSSSSCYKAKQFTGLQGDNLTLNNQPSSKSSSICHPLLMSIALPESGGTGGHNMFCDSLTNTVRYGDCALSLLSSPQSQTSGISLSHLVHPNSPPMAMTQPLGPNLHDHRLDPMDSVLVSSGRDADHIHYAGNFHLGSDESPGNNVSQTLPFHWE